jgi:cytochrome b561
MVARYHASQVVLHWISAVLVLFAWTIGAFVFERVAGSDRAAQLLALRAHMAAGLAFAFVIALRLALRFALEQPPRATSGNAKLDAAARTVHGALYAVALAMAASGLALALSTGLPPIVLGRSQAPIPTGIHDAPAHTIHAAIGVVLISLVAVHTLAALYHQFLRRDALLGRMWFRQGRS